MQSAAFQIKMISTESQKPKETCDFPLGSWMLGKCFSKHTTPWENHRIIPNPKATS